MKFLHKSHRSSKVRVISFFVADSAEFVFFTNVCDAVVNQDNVPDEELDADELYGMEYSKQVF